MPLIRSRASRWTMVKSVRLTTPIGRGLVRLLYLAIALVAIALPELRAQETTGGVRGRLVSPETGPVVNATVIATGLHLQGERRTWSARDGIFFLQALPPGLYTLSVTAIDHRPLEIKDVEIQLGAITGLGELTLEAAAVALRPLEVTAPAATLDPVRTTVGARLTEEDLAVLPVQRDYKSVIAILPHVNESYLGDPPNVGGSTGIENMYFVDGVNVTSELNAATSMTLPYNFVRALEVKAGGYEAQYGRALGAVVNAVTHSGTNEFETAVFGFLTSSGLTFESKALPALQETGAVSFDIGGR